MLTKLGQRGWRVGMWRVGWCEKQKICRRRCIRTCSGGSFTFQRPTPVCGVPQRKLWPLAEDAPDAGALLLPCHVVQFTTPSRRNTFPLTTEQGNNAVDNRTLRSFRQLAYTARYERCACSEEFARTDVADMVQRARLRAVACWPKSRKRERSPRLPSGLQVCPCRILLGTVPILA